MRPFPQAAQLSGFFSTKVLGRLELFPDPLHLRGPSAPGTLRFLMKAGVRLQLPPNSLPEALPRRRRLPWEMRTNTSASPASPGPPVGNCISRTRPAWRLQARPLKSPPPFPWGEPPLQKHSFLEVSPESLQSLSPGLKQMDNMNIVCSRAKETDYL